MPLPKPREEDLVNFDLYARLQTSVILGEPEKIIWSFIRMRGATDFVEFVWHTIHHVEMKSTWRAIAKKDSNIYKSCI